jgi:hypothetical protein
MTLPEVSIERLRPGNEVRRIPIFNGTLGRTGLRNEGSIRKGGEAKPDPKGQKHAIAADPTFYGRT